MTMCNTPIHELSMQQNNRIFVKREDLIPYSFGGNKARKAMLFFEQINSGGYNCVVTYGSSHSNHCRIVANMAAACSIPCMIIAPQEVSDVTYNSKMMELFGAQITSVPVEQVHDVIEEMMRALQQAGRKPYFIPGGGHGNLGTQAYVDCYKEIEKYEKEHKLHFDYIFHASGTGTTQAGLVCGQLMAGDERSIVGISIARKKPRGEDVVLQSVRDYLAAAGTEFSEAQIRQAVTFVDDYTGEGYGKSDEQVLQTIRSVLIAHGIPLDTTYTGKAYAGMLEYLRSANIKHKNILFIHTGGTPLFFDDLKGGL